MAMAIRVGTKSILFGAHAFWLHPWFVAYAWWKLYGFPWDPRLWVAFFVHDLGYWGKPNMDGPEGEQHVLLGANLMYHLFGHNWWEFCAYHSRYWAKRCNAPPSRLCFADKMSWIHTPNWLYLPMAMATKEIYEYMNKHRQEVTFYNDPGKWIIGAKQYTHQWVLKHINGGEDTWTKDRNGI